MGTKGDFLRHAEAMWEQLNRSEPEAGPPVRELWLEWERSMARSSRAKSIKTSRSYLETPVVVNAVVCVLGELQPSGLTSDLMGAWLTSLETMPKQRGRGVLSDGTQYTLRVNMNSFIDYLVDRGLMAKNTLRRLPFSKRIGKRMGYFSPGGDLEEFLSHFPPIIADMYRLSVLSGGLRKSEVIKMRKDRVDHVMQAVTVRRKGGKWWLVRLTSESYQIVRKWSAVSPEHSPYVFADPRSPAGHHIKDGTFYHRMREAQNKFGRRLMGNEKPTHQHLRHSRSLELVDQGADIRDLAADHGLKSPTVLLETYARLRGGPRDAFMEKANANRLLDVGKKAPK